MSSFVFAQEEQDTNPIKLSDLITQHRYPIDISGDALVGSGADTLLAEGRAAEIFMLGENHGIKEIAKISQLLYQELSQETPRILVTEIGPATAYETEQMIRKGSYDK